MMVSVFWCSESAGRLLISSSEVRSDHIFGLSVPWYWSFIPSATMPNPDRWIRYPGSEERLSSPAMMAFRDSS
jgi:hypothetical protein